MVIHWYDGSHLLGYPAAKLTGGGSAAVPAPAVDEPPVEEAQQAWEPEHGAYERWIALQTSVPRAEHSLRRLIVALYELASELDELVSPSTAPAQVPDDDGEGKTSWAAA